MSQRSLFPLIGGVLLIGLVLAVPAQAIIIINSKNVDLVPYSAGQVVRLHVANLGGPDTRGGDCGFIVNWFQPDGTLAQQEMRLFVPPGMVQFADFFDPRTPVGANRVVRIEAVLQPPVDNDLPPGPCIVQVEVFDRLTGRTQYVGNPEDLPAPTAGR
jgi:hypothetical protein